MFHCPPSRVGMTSGDIASFEQRAAARQLARLHEPKLRLSPGPGHSTRRSIIPARQNFGRQRAESSSSEVTLCNASPPSNFERSTALHETGAIQDPSRVALSHGKDGQDTRNDSAQLAVPSSVEHRSPLASSTRRQVDSFYETEQDLINAARLSNLDPSRVDGPADSRGGIQHPPAYPGLPIAKRGNTVLGAVQRDSYPVRTGPGPRPLSSEHARRRRVRNPDHHIYEESEDLQAAIEARHMANVSSRRTDIGPPLDLNRPVEPRWAATTQMLDPDAPVFIPRTRFGTVSNSFGDDVATTDNDPLRTDLQAVSLNLRLRPSTERNIGPLDRRQTQSSRAEIGMRQTSQDIISNTFPHEVGHTYNRRRRASDQNSRLRESGFNLDILQASSERYPPLRPPTIVVPSQGSAPLLGASTTRPGVPSSHSPSRPSGTHGRDEPTQRPALPQHPPHNMQKPAYFSPAAVARPRWQGGRAFSAASLSTPNLLSPLDPEPCQPRRREDQRSSKAFSPAISPVADSNTFNAEYDGLEGHFFNRRPSTRSLDAATEFLRMRNSPLDDLTERLSRLSTTRHGSADQSLDRTGTSQSHVSLLTGNPFRQDSSPDLTLSSDITGADSDQRSIDPAEDCPLVDDPVALALALPPSSPPAPSISVPLVPESPGVRRDTMSPTTSSSEGAPHLSNSVPSASPSTPARSKQPRSNPDRAGATPKMQVYDDSKPARIQPKTPAELERSQRHGRNRSETVVSYSPIAESRVNRQHHHYNQPTGSPAAVPERHPHRNTYPSAQNAALPSTPTTATTQPGAATMTHGSPYLTSTAHRDRPEPGGQVATVAQEENELDAQTPGLERDMRTWLSRREDGSLDVTPPREGRFERYLS